MYVRACERFPLFDLWLGRCVRLSGMGPIWSLSIDGRSEYYGFIASICIGPFWLWIYPARQREEVT